MAIRRIRRTGLVFALASLVACGTTDDSPPIAKNWVLRFVSSDEQPIAGARVRWIVDARPSRSTSVAERETQYGTTDPSGVARLPIPGKHGRLSVWLKLNGSWVLAYDTSVSDSRPQFERDDPPFKVTGTPYQIRARVVDAIGSPIPNVKVQLLASEKGAPLPGLEHRTALDGSVVIEVSGHGNYWLDLSSPGFATRRVCPGLLQEGDDKFLDFVLARSRSLIVVTNDVDGRPAKSELVRYEYPDPITVTGWFARTDPRGVVGFAIPTSEVRVLVPGAIPSEYVIPAGTDDVHLEVRTQH